MRTLGFCTLGCCFCALSCYLPAATTGATSCRSWSLARYRLNSTLLQQPVKSVSKWRVHWLNLFMQTCIPWCGIQSGILSTVSWTWSHICDDTHELDSHLLRCNCPLSGDVLQSGKGSLHERNWIFRSLGEGDFDSWISSRPNSLCRKGNPGVENTERQTPVLKKCCRHQYTEAQYDPHKIGELLCIRLTDSQGLEENVCKVLWWILQTLPAKRGVLNWQTTIARTSSIPSGLMMIWIPYRMPGSPSRLLTWTFWPLEAENIWRLGYFEFFAALASSIYKTQNSPVIDNQW